MTVVMDAGTLREGTLQLIPLVDVLIASETFADLLMGLKTSKKRVLEGLQKMGPRQVVITLGARGSMGLMNDQVVHQKALPVGLKDTTGAGDISY